MEKEIEIELLCELSEAVVKRMIENPLVEKDDVTFYTSEAQELFNEIYDEFETILIKVTK